MDFSWLSAVVGMLSAIPVVGPVVAKILIYAAPVSMVITALIGIWTAVIVLLQALSGIPGLSSLADVATKLQADEDSINGFLDKWVYAILKQLSLIPMPTKSVKKLKK